MTRHLERCETTLRARRLPADARDGLAEIRVPQRHVGDNITGVATNRARRRRFQGRAR